MHGGGNASTRLINGIPHVSEQFPIAEDLAVTRMIEAAVKLSSEGRCVAAGGALYFNGVAVAYLYAAASAAEVEALLVYLDRVESFVRLRKEDFE